MGCLKKALSLALFTRRSQTVLQSWYFEL